MAVKTFQFELPSIIAKEAKMLSAAKHQNVVLFYGLENIIGTNKKALIMEYCDGSLQEMIEKNPNGLPSNEFLPFCRDLVNGMKYLRSKDIIHRDIKPANILLSRHDQKICYKLGDFGAARFLKVNETYGSLYGTYEYVHPDIFARFHGYLLDVQLKQSFKDNHELWSIGITIFEAACGTLPFQPIKKKRRAKKDVRNDCKQTI